MKAERGGTQGLGVDVSIMGVRCLVESYHKGGLGDSGPSPPSAG